MKKIVKRLLGYVLLFTMFFYQFSPALMMVLKAEGNEPSNDITIHFNGGTDGVTVSGHSVTYTVGETSVVATFDESIAISNEAIVVGRNDLGALTFSLTNYDSENMLVRIAGTNDGYGSNLTVENNVASFAGVNSPDEIDLIIEPKPQNQGNQGEDPNSGPVDPGNGGQQSETIHAWVDGATYVDRSSVTATKRVGETDYTILVSVSGADFKEAEGSVYIDVNRSELDNVEFTLDGDYEERLFEVYGFTSNDGSNSMILPVDANRKFKLAGQLVDDTHIGLRDRTPNVRLNLQGDASGEICYRIGQVETCLNSDTYIPVGTELTIYAKPGEGVSVVYAGLQENDNTGMHNINADTATLTSGYAYTIKANTELIFSADFRGQGGNPGPNNGEMVVSFDGATYVDSTHITILKANTNESYTLTLSGGEFVVDGEGNEAQVNIHVGEGELDGITLTFDNTFDPSQIDIIMDGNRYQADNNRSIKLFSRDGGYHFGIEEHVNGPQSCSGPNCVDTTVNYYFNGEVADVVINNSMVISGENHAQPEEVRDGQGNITKYYIQANERVEDSDETVSLTVSTLFINYFTKLEVNGVDYSNSLPKTKQALFDAFFMQRTNVNLEVAKSDTGYTIYTETVEATADTTAVGNFLWTTNPDEKYQRECVMGDGEHCDEWRYFTDNEGNKIVNDDYVDHATLEILSVTYNGVTKTKGEAGTGFDFNTSNNQQGATLPVGSIITVRITPDYGYQLTEFTINGGAFTATNEVGVYTFEIKPGNFHLGAHVTKVEDEVKAESSKVSEGAITLNNNLSEGSAQLTVNDANIDSNKIKGFENAAKGYEVKNVLDIDLYQVVYKGTDNSNDVWSTKISELNNKATISIKLEEGVNAEDIVIVHNIHDGETFEIIPIDSYDPKTRTITFKTNSFSNFAIATKGEDNTPVTVTYTVVFDNEGLLSEVEVKEGKTVKEPAEPVKDGFVFVGWHDSKGNKFDFSTPIRDDIQLLAVFDKAFSLAPQESNNSNDKAAAEATNEVIVCIQKGEVSEEVINELDPNLASALEDARENNKAITVDLTTDTVDEDQIDEETLEKINEAVKEDEVVLGFFEIDLNVLVDGQEVGKLTRLENPIKITVDASDMIKDLPKTNDGYTRTYVVIRLHNGETDIIPATLNADGTVDFVTDRFSTYTLAYVDIKNPKTGDSIVYFIVMLGVSLLGLISTLLYKKCSIKIEK